MALSVRSIVFDRWNRSYESSDEFPWELGENDLPEIRCLGGVCLSTSQLQAIACHIQKGTLTEEAVQGGRRLTIEEVGQLVRGL